MLLREVVVRVRFSLRLKGKELLAVVDVAA
jgi:hypothetical protein